MVVHGATGSALSSGRYLPDIDQSSLRLGRSIVTRAYDVVFPRLPVVEQWKPSIIGCSTGYRVFVSFEGAYSFIARRGPPECTVVVMMMGKLRLGADVRRNKDESNIFGTLVLSHGFDMTEGLNDILIALHYCIHRF